MTNPIKRAIIEINRRFKALESRVKRVEVAHHLLKSRYEILALRVPGSPEHVRAIKRTLGKMRVRVARARAHKSIPAL